jgi:predicted ATPase/class 3 adenylate cyclase
VIDPRRMPSGTVAFLFTDIEGSTVRWDSHREAMQEALRRHDRILRSAIDTHGGFVFKTIGDAFCAAFSSVGEALEGAIDSQRRLAGEDFAAVDGVRVRMAVHVGETDERDGDYFGPAVNRVARLLSAGHGAQVLVSGAAADAVGVELPDGAGLRHLGMLPLRDLKDPERVFQLTAPGLVSDFKALRALETPPNNLPRQASSFVGRNADLARVKDLLATGVLVTVVGTGGVGKTRLALAAATDVLNDLPDGAWFVDFAPLSDSSLVASAILSGLGVDQTTDAPALDVLVGYLKQRGLLLVLDNCEHLIAEVARVVAAVLAACPEIGVLATSREMLNVTGERAHRLSSLDDVESVALFTERARAVRPDFRAEAKDVATIEDICRRLDGIALAIELAAARVRSISLDELSQRLRLRMLGTGARDRQPRQQTMHALIDWSYDLLTSDEQRLFRGISIFAGGFTLEAAGASSDESQDEWDVLDLLTSLSDKSLLVADVTSSNQRYRLLESIREYGRERLDAAGEMLSLVRRHAEFFCSLADRAYVEWDTAPAVDWLSRLRPELDNFRAGLRWTLDEKSDPELGALMAASLAPMFMRLSLLHEGIGWCESALGFKDALAPSTKARLYYGLSMLQHNHGEDAGALRSARQAVELYRTAKDERGLVRALSQVAQHLPTMDAHEEALLVAEEALEHARGLNDDRLLAATLQRCARAYKPSEIAGARRRFAQSVELFRSLHRDDETARALAWWANVEAEADEFKTAAEISEQALELASDDLKLFLVSSLASLYLALGDDDRAWTAAREALRRAVEGRYPFVLPQAMLYLAALGSDADPSSAATLFGYAEARLRVLGWKCVGPDRVVERKLENALAKKLRPEDLRSLRAAGSGWTEQEAVANASRL